MNSHRSRFLTSLSERLQSDLAAREREREDLAPPDWHQATEQPEPGGDERLPDASARDDIAARKHAARVEQDQDAESGADAPPDAYVPTETAEPTPHLSVPWSEIGMPPRLREAIASVRRVSHEMYEPPGDGYGTDAPPPFDHDLDHCGYWVDDDAAYGTASADDRAARSGDSGDGQVSSGARLPEADRPPDESRALLDEDAEFQPEEPPLDADYGRYEAVRAGDELLPLDEEAPDDRTRLAFGAHSGYEQPPPEYGPIALDHAPTYRADQIGPEDDPLDHPPTHPRARTGLDEDALYERPELDEGHGPIWLGDGAGPGSALGGSEDAGDSPPLWRTARTRYGLHAAAFAVAIAFVAIAGFGLGLLSDERTAVGPPERDTVSAEAGAEPPSPSAGRSTQPAAPERPAGLSELVTVRVAPAPVAAVPQQPPEARASTSAPPLPPPPKPALRQSPPVQPASTDRLLAGVVDDAAAAQLEAEDAKAGAGGPFQPLFTKLPAMPPPDTRVFVHYSAGAVGAPATAMHLVRHLKAEGFTVEARPVEFAIPTSSVRYFFDADRKEAEALRAALQGQIPGGAAMPVMDFTSYEPKPRPGLIEIWLRA